LGDSPRIKHFTVDARAMLTWGRESIKDHTTAILELVKNSYDAGASEVVVEISVGVDSVQRFIRIVDNGSGMTESEIDLYWLRIGYSHKLAEKYCKNGRRKTGEKGIGRISADRLGEVLEIRTRAKDNPPIGLRINWRDFEIPGRDIEQVAVTVLEATAFTLPGPNGRRQESTQGSSDSGDSSSPKDTGTELRISSLRHQWNQRDIKSLCQELSVLTPPFGGVKDFQIILQNDLEPSLNGPVASPFYSSAEVEAEFSHLAGEVSYKFRDRDERGRARTSDQGVEKWQDLIHPEEPFDQASGDNGSGLGKVEVKLLFYLRSVETLRGTNLTMTGLRNFLDTNAGIKVYRDNIRVMPYGSLGRPEGDWLGLGDRKTRNPAGPGRSDFRVAPDQIVGGVFLGRDSNPNIIDTSGREGLVHSDQFYMLRAFLLGCLVMIEEHYHNLYVSRNRNQESVVSSPRENALQVKANLNKLIGTLREASSQLPNEASDAIDRVKDQLAKTAERLEEFGEATGELASQAIIYRGLASLGIAAATFAHETESSIDSFLSAAYAARTILNANQTWAASGLRN
jgi:hypothetical protein